MSTDDTLPPVPERRARDPRVKQLIEDLEVLKERQDKAVIERKEIKDQLAENTLITMQVRDILTSFRVVGAVAKWVSLVVAGILAVYHGWQNVTGR